MRVFKQFMHSPTPTNRFNIRVYGLWISEEREILLTDEYRSGHYMTKFPGGGLEFGEGLSDALKREWKEELSIEIKIGKLFYINEFFQVSAFSKKDQILSVYYQVEPLSFPELAPHKRLEDLEAVEGAQAFRWFPLDNLREELTFPIDKKVAGLLQKC